MFINKQIKRQTAEVIIIITVTTKAIYLAPARGAVNRLPGITIDHIDRHTMR